jgi:hypothetical protein
LINRSRAIAAKRRLVDNTKAAICRNATITAGNECGTSFSGAEIERQTFSKQFDAHGRGTKITD